MLEVKIGKMRIILPEELEQRFREKIEETPLEEALIEAIEEWIAKHELQQ